MKKKIFILIMLFCLIFSLYTIVFSQGNFKKVDLLCEDIILKSDRENMNLKGEAFYYKNKLYAPVSKVVKIIGGQGFWNKKKNEIIIKHYNDFPKCEYEKEEVFAYGFILSINYEEKEIEIEQYLDDTTKKTPSKLKVVEEPIIVLQRNDKKMNLSFSDLKAGEDVGMILDKDGKVKAIILQK